MWLIARRSLGEGRLRLVATLLAALGSIALIAGSLQFALRAQEAVAGGDASEFFRADVLVQGGTADPGDPGSPPDGRVRLDRVASRPGVAAAVGDASVAVTAIGSDGRAITAAAEGRTLLRPWVSDPGLAPYRLAEGRAPAGDGEVAVVRYMARAGKAGVGDVLTLTLPRETRRVTVTGVVTVQGRDAVAAGNLVLAPPETVRRAAMLPAGTWQSVWLKAAPGVPGVRVLDRGPYVDAASSSLTRPLRATYTFIGMALLLALFGMATTVSMGVAERTREFGLLGAVGATRRQIRAIVRWEAATVVALGTALGLAIAMGTLTLLHVTTGSSFLRPDPPWWLFPVVAAGAAAATLTTTALPARRAAAVPVLEAAKAE